MRSAIEAAGLRDRNPVLVPLARPARRPQLGVRSWGAPSARPYYAKDGITIYHGDCREVLPRLRQCSIDLIVTDPPYRSFKPHSPWSGDGRRKPPWFATLANDELRRVLADVRGLLRPDGALYVFTDVKTGLELFPPLKPANVLVWDKQQIGLGYGWRRMHEWIAYCPQTKHRLRSHRHGDILRCPRPRHKTHPTEKPLALLETLIANSSNRGDLVLDPFMGSGATLLAAQRLGRRAIGIELDERYCDIAAESLRRDMREATPAITSMLSTRRRLTDDSAPLGRASRRRRAAAG